LLPNGAPVQVGGLSNADVAPNRFDNATGQLDLAETTNSADGVSLTVEYEWSDTLHSKFLISDRSSDYTAGLDDDSTAVNFLAFGEIGSADQTSVEFQLNGDYGSWDFVTGIYYFEEEGINDQPNFTFNAGGGSETLKQELTSFAVYANVGFNVNDRLRVAGGLRYTEDEKDANVDLIFGLIDASASQDFDEVSWDLSLTYEINEKLTAYGSIANGYQSGQFNPRPFCLFGFLDFTQPGNVSRPNCFDQDLQNITAINFEAGIKGELGDNFQMSLAVFSTDYEDLPYQVSTTSGAGFNTVNIIVDQTSTGVEWESSWRVAEGFYLNASLGYIDVDVDDPVAVAPLTPDLTVSISPSYTMDMNSGGTLSFRADYSYRDDMFGEPSPDPGRNTRIESRDLINLDVTYNAPDDAWRLSLYGRNVTDERYENARLNTGDYILAILGNDASEFGLRYVKNF
jgi:iron complex outermembrane receptor protein